jgi:hypothetical protein
MIDIPRLTLDEIRAGAPHGGWQELIQSESRAASRHVDADSLTEWAEGAWAAVHGHRDPTPNCGCEWRRGYDWAARLSLEVNGWEAWNLAWREVEEHRPIGRSSKFGVRYYGRDHEHVPAEISRLPPVDVALWKALHGMQGALLRWDIYRQLGVTDDDLALAISREFGTVNSGVVGGVHYYAQGCKLFGGTGQTPHLSLGDYGSEQKIRGTEIVRRSRSLLALPEPGALHLDLTQAAQFSPPPAGLPVVGPALTLIPHRGGGAASLLHVVKVIGAEQLALF